MKNLQEYVRRKCIEAIFKLPYEQAVKTQIHYKDILSETPAIKEVKPNFTLTLPAIMQAVRKHRYKDTADKQFVCDEDGGMYFASLMSYEDEYDKFICDWTMFDKGKELTFNDQSEETQRSIGELLSFKE